MGTNILPAATLSDISDSEAERLVEDANGFAQVFPEHKYHIVELLQGKHHIFGMAGDGANDAPALKKSRCRNCRCWRHGCSEIGG